MARLIAAFAAVALLNLATANPAGYGKTITVTKTKEIERTKYHTKTETKTVTATASCAASSPVSASSSVSASASSAAPSSYPSQPASNHWPGWEGISHMIVFGDSYTTTGFNLSLAQPSSANPLGNPAYPGYTATNGPNWVDFLTTTYNATFLETINLAYGGATVDSALVAPYLPTVLSLKQQVQDEFLPYYADPSVKGFNWAADDTLFATFIGINDVGNAYGEANKSVIYPAEFEEYAGLMDQLYQSGARNFLFLNVPPVDRSPLTVGQGAASAATEAVDVAAWNANVTALAANLSSTYSDAFTYVFDTNAVFTQVLDDPCAFPETCAYRNTTDYCESCECTQYLLSMLGLAFCMDVFADAALSV